MYTFIRLQAGEVYDFISDFLELYIQTLQTKILPNETILDEYYDDFREIIDTETSFELFTEYAAHQINEMLIG